MPRRGDRGRSAEIRLPARASSPGAARRFVAKTLEGWRFAGGDDAILVVSELVTNALLHARTPMTVTLAEDGDALRLSVTDGSMQELQQRHFSADSGTGRGLRLLASLASEWGVEWHGDGKTVWARIEPGHVAYAFDVDAIEAL